MPILSSLQNLKIIQPTQLTLCQHGSKVFTVCTKFMLLSWTFGRRYVKNACMWCVLQYLKRLLRDRHKCAYILEEYPKCHPLNGKVFSSSYGNAFCFTGPLRAASFGDPWILLRMEQWYRRELIKAYLIIHSFKYANTHWSCISWILTLVTVQWSAMAWVLCRFGRKLISLEQHHAVYSNKYFCYARV